MGKAVRSYATDVAALIIR